MNSSEQSPFRRAGRVRFYVLLLTSLALAACQSSEPPTATPAITTVRFPVATHRPAAGVYKLIETGTYNHPITLTVTSTLQGFEDVFDSVATHNVRDFIVRTDGVYMVGESFPSGSCRPPSPMLVMPNPITRNQSWTATSACSGVGNYPDLSTARFSTRVDGSVTIPIGASAVATVVNELDKVDTDASGSLPPTTIHDTLYFDPVLGLTVRDDWTLTYGTVKTFGHEVLQSLPPSSHAT